MLAEIKAMILHTEFFENLASIHNTYRATRGVHLQGLPPPILLMDHVIQTIY